MNNNTTLNTGDKTGLNVLSILDALPFYVLLIDQNHNILEANEAVAKELKVKKEDIIGHYCPLVIHGLQHPFPGCPLEEAVGKNEAIERELLDNESGRWVISSVYPTSAYTTDNKRVYLHMVTDITARKRAENQLRIAHEQLRRTSVRLETVREEEKREIARNLHDEMSQQLASLYAHLEAAIGTLPNDIDKTRKLLKKAQTMATTVLDEVHNLIYELRPSIIDEMGLVPAIGYLADRHLKTAGIKVKIKTINKTRRLASTLEIALFRIVQESFNNIVKHSGTNMVTVTIAFKKSSIKLSIKDNGMGFNLQKVLISKNKKRGLGLLGMRERADLINGKLSIESSPGHGTEITVEVPLKKEGDNGQN